MGGGLGGRAGGRLGGWLGVSEAGWVGPGTNSAGEGLLTRRSGVGDPFKAISPTHLFMANTPTEMIRRRPRPVDVNISTRSVRGPNASPTPAR